jgi:cytochrome c553
MTLSPEQFNKIALKADTDRISADLQDFKEEMRQFRSDMFKIMDGVVKRLDNIQIESVSNIAAHDRFESRITHLEKTLL